METSSSQPTPAELAEKLKIPAEQAKALDTIIDPLLDMLRSGDEKGAEEAIAALDDSGELRIFQVGRRASERKIGYMRTHLAAGMLGMLASADNPRSGQEIMQNHQSEQQLIMTLENMIIRDENRRMALIDERRRERGAEGV